MAVSISHDIFGFSLQAEKVQSSQSSPPNPPGPTPTTAQSTISRPSTSSAAPHHSKPGTPPDPFVTVSSKPAAATKSTKAVTNAPGPACHEKITITAPADGSRIAGKTGVELRGTACGLQTGERGWVFDFDPYDGFYYSADGPAIVTNGKWVYRNEQVGDSGDNNKFYTLQVVLASAACSDFLAGYEVNAEGDKRLQRSDFPRSCQFVADLDVSVTWPS